MSAISLSLNYLFPGFHALSFILCSTCDPSSGPERFPPPSPFLDLSRSELFFTLIQLLLRAKSPLFRR